MNHDKLNYSAAKSVLEQAGVEFKNPSIVYSTGTKAHEAFEKYKGEAKKTRMSKSQLRREAKK